jgi:hypothetical protein
MIGHETIRVLTIDKAVPVVVSAIGAGDGVGLVAEGGAFIDGGEAARTADGDHEDEVRAKKRRHT